MTDPNLHTTPFCWLTLRIICIRSEKQMPKWDWTCKRFIEGNVGKRKSCRRWGETLDHDAGGTAMKERGRKEKCHRLRSSSKTCQQGQWESLRRSHPSVRSGSSSLGHSPSLAGSSSWEASPSRDVSGHHTHLVVKWLALLHHAQWPIVSLLSKAIVIGHYASVTKFRGILLVNLNFTVFQSPWISVTMIYLNNNNPPTTGSNFTFQVLLTVSE